VLTTWFEQTYILWSQRQFGVWTTGECATVKGGYW